MKSVVVASLSALLLLGGCGGSEGGEGNATAAASDAPLKSIPAPQGDWSQVVSETAEGGFRMGNPDAPVKLVEYASLTCPHCRDFSNSATEELVGTYVKSGQVSWEFRNLVLNSVDLAATLLARCQGAAPFFGLAEQTYRQQDEWLGRFQSVSPDVQARIQALPQNQQVPALAEAGGLLSFFQMRGLPSARAQQCLSDNAAIERLVKVGQEAAEKHGITGTPNFLINNEKVEGAATWDALEPELRGAIG